MDTEFKTIIDKVVIINDLDKVNYRLYNNKDFLVGKIYDYTSFDFCRAQIRLHVLEGYYILDQNNKRYDINKNGKLEVFPFDFFYHEDQCLNILISPTNGDDAGVKYINETIEKYTK